MRHASWVGCYTDERDLGGDRWRNGTRELHHPTTVPPRRAGVQLEAGAPKTAAEVVGLMDQMAQRVLAMDLGAGRFDTLLGDFSSALPTQVF